MLKNISFKFLIFCFYIIISVNLNAQQTKVVDFTYLEAKLKLDTLEKSVSGKVKLNFICKKDIDRIYLDAKNFTHVIASNSSKISEINYTENKIWFLNSFKKDSTYTYYFDYKTTPKKALYFWGWNDKNVDEKSPNHKQIWTQGQGKYTSNWLPSSDDMNDKIIFDLQIEFDATYIVTSNGALIKSEISNNTNKLWHYKMQQPMSSYLVALSIGKYTKTIENSDNGASLENYIYPNRIADYKSTYKYSKQIFDFLEKSIGVPYPWDTYRQIPVRDFLYAGMENTGCTIFSDDYIVDDKAFKDQNYISVNAHELTHQWFGNLITETTSEHHWLHEGFATYYALLAEKELFGEDYFYFKLYENAEQLNAQTEKKKATPLVYPNGNSLTYYQHGAWALVALKELIGKNNFNKGIIQFLNTYAFKNVTTDDFLSIISQNTTKDLTNYKNTWLYGNTFPSEKALDILKESKFMRDYLQLAGERTQPLAGKYLLLSKALDFPVNPYLGQEVVNQLHDDNSREALSLLQKAFNTNDSKVQNALANSLTTIPESLAPDFEKLLSVDSYSTVEAALYNLWNNFEKNKKKYLNKTKNSVGFNDKNIRTLWLVLALNTPGYSNQQRSRFFKELQQYTATNHNYLLRQNAFKYLELLQSFSDASLLNLSNGATHPNWRFNQYCTSLLKRLLKNPKYITRFIRLKSELPNKVVKLIPTE